MKITLDQRSHLRLGFPFANRLLLGRDPTNNRTSESVALSDELDHRHLVDERSPRV